MFWKDMIVAIACAWMMGVRESELGD